MKHARRLVLRTERLGELTGRQLSAVAGASGDTCTVCPTEGISCVRCPSVPLTNCTILQETNTCTCPTDIC